MSPSTLDQEHTTWLERHARSWVEAGLISEDQAVAIAEFEGVRPREPQRLSTAAEVAAYLGSVLAIMGGAVAISGRWEDISLFGRVGIGIAIAVVGFLAGTWLMEVGEAGTSRLGSFLWAVGTGGVAITVGVFVDEVDSSAGGWMPLLIGLPVMAIGLGQWRNLDRPLQFLTAAIGFAMTLSGLAEIADVNIGDLGVVFLTTGVVCAVGSATGHLEPRWFVLATGSSGAYLGSFMLSDYNEHLGPAAAAIVATSLVVFALRERRIPLLVLGVAGALLATQALLATTFSGAAASMVVTMLGLAIVVGAVMKTRRAA